MKTKKFTCRGRIIYLILCTTLLFSCSKDDPDPENRPPERFELLTVADKAGNVDLKPSFSWNASTDPDGDAVSYTLYMDENANPTTEIAGGLTQNSYTPTEPLFFEKIYYWKVVASDGKGGNTESEVFSFSTREIGKPQSAGAKPPFDPRAGSATVVFDDKLWVIGGDIIGPAVGHDVWYTSNGKDWTRATAGGAFLPRYYHTALAFKGKMWVMGGNYGGSASDDVYTSTDGKNWIEIKGGNFPARSTHSAVVFDDKMWIIGGNDGSLRNDVWYSEDGKSWTQATANADFSPRGFHSSVVFDGKIWVIGGVGGGGPQDDVWYSEDGKNWKQASPMADFGLMYGHKTVALGGRMWLVGYTNDIWYSSDGLSWEKSATGASYKGRLFHNSAVFMDKIWIIAGVQGGQMTDAVWYLE